MIILGVDPGLRTSGYAVIEQHQRQLQVVDAGTFRADTEPPLPGRLLQIYRDID
ncbi:MAG: crossover junction endodeoxyribonuclease RuvC, partial [Sedimentisphaerales bacterium]|nr:crossover junction endodeoxyribonuclease RuvC [Sedimentisphaerales bacterium]